MHVRFTRLDEVPVILTKLSVCDVNNCLSLLNLEKYIPEFTRNNIDGVKFATLSTDRCVNDFGLSTPEAVKLSLFIEGWRPCR